MKPLRRLLLLSPLLGLATPAHADPTYPDRPVKIIVPFTAGGFTGTAAQILAEEMGKLLKNPFVVDYRPGAGGNIAAQVVANAAPDGYTLLLSAPSVMSINRFLYKSLPFDPDQGFANIATFGQAGYVLVINPSLPVHSVGDLVHYTKANPGKVNYASGGVGTVTHLAAAMFLRRAGIDVTHVPYGGTPPAVNDLMSGQVQLMFNSITDGAPKVRTNALRALAVTSLTRDTALPDIPTMAQAGFPEYEAVAWVGLAAPAGTSSAIVEMLQGAAEKALKDPEVVRRFAAIGVQAAFRTAAETTAYIAQETAKWGAIVKTDKIEQN